MKAFIFYFLFFILTKSVSAQELKEEIKITICIMDALKIKIRSTYDKYSVLPKLKIGKDEKGYSAYYNGNKDKPEIFISGNTNLFLDSPQQYNLKFKIDSFPKKTKTVDSLRHMSTLIHELTHYLEDTFKYKSLYPSANCKNGDVFCYVRYPTEFDAYTVEASFVLLNFNRKLFNQIMKKNKSLDEKKVEIINAVYCDMFNHSNFKRPLTLADLIGISTR